MLLHELKQVDEGFVKNMAKGAAFAALVGASMSGTYGYNKLLRDQDPDEVEVSQETTDAYHKQKMTSKGRLLALAKRTRAKRMNPKASNTENIPFSGSRPNDAEASMGSRISGSRYQGSTSSVNDG